MRRRQFVLASSIGTIAALSGCLGGDDSPPPRRSNVVTDLATSDGSLTVDLANDSWVKSRFDGNQGSLAGANPVGVAAAKGKGGGGGRGATGRGSGGYSSAPRSRHGYAVYHGGDYGDDWYDDHDDDVTQYPVDVSEVGVAYLGTTSRLQDEAPDAGAVPWDKRFRNPGDSVSYDISRDGWYRVGANIVGQNGHDFRWESYDVELDGSGGSYSIDEQWKVSPRI